MDLSGKHESLINPALTDMGLCSVYNGNALRNTFKRTERTKLLGDTLDVRRSFEPEMIKGTGRIAEHTFWLNLADR